MFGHLHISTSNFLSSFITVKSKFLFLIYNAYIYNILSYLDFPRQEVCLPARVESEIDAIGILYINDSFPLLANTEYPNE